MSPIPWLSALAAGAALASQAAAGPLTFAEAVDRASETAPGLRASALQVEANRRAAEAAGRLPDPRLTLDVDNVPVSGPNAWRLGRDEMTMARVGVMQDVPNGARRRAERERARSEVRVAEAGRREEARRTRAGAALAWVDLHFTERRLAALDDFVRTLEPVWATQPAAVASGSARPAQGLAADRLRAELRDRRSALVAAAGKARAELARWTGEPAPSAEGPPPSLQVDDAALRAGIDRHPALLVYGSSLDRAQAEVALARADKRPDWSWEVSYGRRDPDFGDMVSAGVSVRLPLFTARRQDPLIEARAAEAARIELQRADARRALVAGLEGDLAEHAMHHEQLIRARDTLLPLADQRADLETASYAAGRAGLVELMEAYMAFAEATLLVVDREAETVRDAVRINVTYGAES